MNDSKAKDDSPSSNGFSRIKKRRLFDGVVEQLTESIIRGDHKPGDRLPSEKELGHSFGVGRTAIREGLRVLENAGLVYVRPGAGGGAFVKDMGSTHLLNSFETIIRVNRLHLDQIVESLLVFEKALWPLVFERITADDLIRLEDSLNQAKEAIEKGSTNPRNLEFYVILAEASRNQLLAVMTNILVDVLRKYLRQLPISFERKKKVLRGNQAILENIKARNYEQGLQMVEKHFSDLARFCREVTVSSPDPDYSLRNQEGNGIRNKAVKSDRT